jgi:hypothetical protein
MKLRSVAPARPKLRGWLNRRLIEMPWTPSRQGARESGKAVAFARPWWSAQRGSGSYFLSRMGKGRAWVTQD